MKSLYSPQNNARGFLFGVIVSNLMFIIGLLTIDLLSGIISINDIVTSIYEYSGIFTGYTDFNMTIIFAILFASGVIMGTSGKSFKEGFGEILTFFIVQFLIFFGIGLLYLGNHYDYENDLFQNYIITIIFPMIILIIGLIFGMFAIKKPPKHIIAISNF